MTGMDLRKSTRKPDHLKRLPFLLATAEARKEYIIEVAQVGADDYIVKPFTSATLNDKAEVIFKRKGQI